MFDLNIQISEWRASILQSESFSKDNVDELESHLCESISQLVQQGLSAEEAFWVGLRRLGDTKALAVEFSKVHPTPSWSKRWQWMLIGYLIVALGKTAIMTVAGFASALGAMRGLNGVAGSLVYILGTILLSSLVTLLVVARVRRTGEMTSLLTQRLLTWGRSHYIIAIIFFGICLVVMTVAERVSRALFSLFSNMAESARFEHTAEYFHFVVSVALPFVLLLVILWLSRQSRTAAHG